MDGLDVNAVAGVLRALENKPASLYTFFQHNVKTRLTYYHNQILTITQKQGLDPRIIKSVSNLIFEYAFACVSQQYYETYQA